LEKKTMIFWAGKGTGGGGEGKKGDYRGAKQVQGRKGTGGGVLGGKETRTRGIESSHGERDTRWPHTGSLRAGGGGGGVGLIKGPARWPPPTGGEKGGIGAGDFHLNRGGERKKKKNQRSTYNTNHG